MSSSPLSCTVRRTESTTDLLTVLNDDDPDFESYLLASWSPGPPAEEDIVLPALAALLIEPLTLRKPRTGHTPSRRLTWHCSIRSSGALSDDQWFELTWKVLDATGIEPDGDPDACRWVALRNTADRLDLVATVIRQDGRWARLHNDQRWARFACEDFARDRGLTPQH
ncbi:hypothetical protein [Kitasatospora brasiliensis]|uniref:hypothetical protein n=1 Tax=Kitasatospora brasiliensis TaxID=3058040 RepID=UPI00292EE2BC|nr:hypothetical protein [Kitasatospora sp. K002]